MSQAIADPPIDYRLCRYTGCPVEFRGPRVDLAQPFMAVLGSSEVFGRYVREPFPDLIADHLRIPVANFGVHNGGLDVILRDDALKYIASSAPVVVLQVMGAHNMSNRFYSVHSRRNDRFLRYSRAFQHLFKTVDFTDFVFVRHMLQELRDTDPDAFAQLVEELEISWIARMERLLGLISGKVILLWIRNRQVTPLGSEPLFVSPKMIDRIRTSATEVVEIDISQEMGPGQLEDMVFAPTERQAAELALPPLAHEQIGRHLVETLEPIVTHMKFPKPTLVRNTGEVA